MMLLCGLPLLYMELTVGQYTRRGPVGALKAICPLLGGVGLAIVIMTFLMSTYYNILITWSIFFFISSFFSPLPWESCNN